MVDKPEANEVTIASLRDLQGGLHYAIDCAFKRKDEAKLKITLHQMDDHLTRLINTLAGANTGRW